MILTEESSDWSAVPDCSPVASGVVFTSNRVWKENQTTQVDNLWLTNATGGYLLQLTRTDTCENQNPGFSPDGLQIAFFRTYYPDQIGENGVWTISTDGAGSDLWQIFLILVPVPARSWHGHQMAVGWYIYWALSRMRQRFTWWRHKAAFRSFSAGCQAKQKA